MESVTQQLAPTFLPSKHITPLPSKFTFLEIMIGWEQGLCGNILRVSWTNFSFVLRFPSLSWRAQATEMPWEAHLQQEASLAGGWGGPLIGFLAHLSFP
jgi:hypothetical protein